MTLPMSEQSHTVQFSSGLGVADTEKYRPSLATALSLFVLGAGVALMIGIGGVVYIGLGKSLSATQETAIEQQIEHMRQHIDTLLERYTLILQDTAKFPVLVQGVMQPEMMEVFVADFMDGIFLLGKQEQLALLDYRGRLIHATKPFYLFNYQEQYWVKELVDGVIERHIGINQIRDYYFWHVAVPVRFNGQTEGILVGQFPFSVLSWSLFHWHSLPGATNRLEFLHKGHLIGAHGPKNAGVSKDFQLPALELVLRFFWDQEALEQEKESLLLKIVLSLVLLTILILGLALATARRYIAKPLENLRRLTHTIATGSRMDYAPKDFPLRELLLLSRDFDLMADNIRSREKSLENEVRERSQAEAALLESEQRFRTLVEYAPEAIAVVDMDAGCFVDANQNAIKLFGYPRKDLLKRGPVDVSPVIQPNGRPSVELAREMFDKVDAGEVPLFEWLHCHVSGRQFPCEIRLVRLPTMGRKLMRGSITDITQRKQAEALKRISDLVFQTVRELIAVISPEYSYQRVNRAFCEIFGLTESDMVGRYVVDMVGEETFNKRIKPNLDRCFAGEAVEYEGWVHLFIETSPRYLVIKYSPLRDGIGPVIGALAISYDITDRKRAEQLLFEEKERAQITLKCIGDAVISTDAHGHVDFLNPIAENLTGWQVAEAKGRLLADIFCIIDEETRQPVEDPVARCLRESKPVGLINHTVLVSRSGKEYAIEDSAAPIYSKNAEVLGTVMVFRDVTEARRLTQQIFYQAAHDALTGLINRTEFDRRLRRVLETAHTNATENALAYLDLDQFKLVNDTCGHVAGDELLRQLGQLLRQHIRKRDTLARLGGDEFGLLMEHCSLKEAQRVAENLIKAVANFSFPWEEHSFRVGISIGLVLVDQDSPTVEGIMSAADSACYMAKEQGRNRFHLHQEHDTALAKRHGEMQWAVRIPQALEEERLLLYCQKILPIEGANADQGNRYELLLRMKDETGNLILPGAFLPAAERYNLSDKLDSWTVKRAFRWLQTHPGHLRQLYSCSINLSGLSLSNQAFRSCLIRALEESGIPPEKICFEITETVAIANLSSATLFIKGLKKRGCRFALDDFGSGLSSFAYLKNLPVDFLKIDGLFVKDILDDPMNLAMVRSINHIGHVMGKQTIAEFVESDAVLQKLTEIGVDYAQGYSIGQPQPLDDILTFQ